MLKWIFVLFVPALLQAQQVDTLSFLIDRVKGGNEPGLIVAIYHGEPWAAVDTTGGTVWDKEAGKAVPVTREVLRGWAYTPVDSAGKREKRLLDIEVNWSLADTALNLPVELPDSLVIMNMKLLSGQLWPQKTAFTDSLIAADSTWRVDR